MIRLTCGHCSLAGKDVKAGLGRRGARTGTGGGNVAMLRQGGGVEHVGCTVRAVPLPRGQTHIHPCCTTVRHKAQAQREGERDTCFDTHFYPPTHTHISISLSFFAQTRQTSITASICASSVTHTKVLLSNCTPRIGSAEQRCHWARWPSRSFALRGGTAAATQGRAAAAPSAHCPHNVLMHSIDSWTHIDRRLCGCSNIEFQACWALLDYLFSSQKGKQTIIYLQFSLSLITMPAYPLPCCDAWMGVCDDIVGVWECEHGYGSSAIAASPDGGKCLHAKVFE